MMTTNNKRTIKKTSCFPESSLPGKIHPSTPAMYKFRPSFGTMPKVHYHATGEKVGHKHHHNPIFVTVNNTVEYRICWYIH